MKSANELSREIEALRERVARLGAPMRHRDVQVGNFFLGEKEGGRELTGEDEELLVLFASQAATAITNARTHRASQAGRALEGRRLEGRRLEGRRCER